MSRIFPTRKSKSSISGIHRTIRTSHVILLLAQPFGKPLLPLKEQSTFSGSTFTKTVPHILITLEERQHSPCCRFRLSDYTYSKQATRTITALCLVSDLPHGHSRIGSMSGFTVRKTFKRQPSHCVFLRLQLAVITSRRLTRSSPPGRSGIAHSITIEMDGSQRYPSTGRSQPKLAQRQFGY